jgi:hypothetical protein
VKVLFLARDRERTVTYAKMILMKSFTKKKFTRAWSRAKNETFTVFITITFMPDSS